MQAEQITPLRYILAWLFMPMLAVRHKLKRVTYYEVVTDKGCNVKHYNYIDAGTAFDAIVDHGQYGEFIKLIEHYKDGTSSELKSLKW